MSARVRLSPNFREPRRSCGLFPVSVVCAAGDRVPEGACADIWPAANVNRVLRCLGEPQDGRLEDRRRLLSLQAGVLHQVTV